MDENWKDIVGFEGIFAISNIGRIKSYNRYVNVGNGGKRLVKGKILTPVKCKNGYLEAQLVYKGKRKVFLLHRLVATTFIPNPLNYPEVNHKDENIKNCSADNLEWCTSKYNANYGTRNIRIMEKKELKPVLQYSKTGEFLNRYKSISDACRNTGADISSIIRVCKGKQHTSFGFVWKYEVQYE